jgi:hypothetical protein
VNLSSSAFQHNGLIPTKYAHQGVTGGSNLSIPLSWDGVPAGTRSFALSVIDPHPVANNWVHWIVVNIPSDARALAEGASRSLMPSGVKELYTSYGTTGYGGPEPPKGSGPHPYVVTLYALSCAALDCALATSRTAFLKLLEGEVLASATLTGIYER